MGIKQEDIEYDQIINQTKFFNDYMEEEKDDYIPVNVCTQETYKEVNSSTNKEIQVESHIPFIETNKYVPNIEVDAKTVDTYDISSVVAKEAHIANNDLKQTTRHLGNNEEGQDNWENNICQDERPVELNEDLIVSASCDNFVSEEQNNVKITETCIVSNVKGVEIKSCFTFHQLNEIEDTEYLTSDSKDISLEANRETCFSIREDNNSENKEEDEKVDTHSNASCTNSRENLVHASCTIENNHPVIITACNLQLNSEDLQSQSTRNDINEGNAIDHAAEENGQIKDLNEETLNNNDYIFNDLKQHLRRTPRKSITSETKIREAQLMKSFLEASPKESVEFGEEKDCHPKSPKSSIIFSTLNANVKKHSYKIRFKVKVGAESSKSSVLQYLLGCFGGEKLIPAKK